jgi:hypothetical protein
LIGAFNFRALLPNSKESILESRIRTIIISDYDDLWYLNWKSGTASSPSAIHHYIESAAKFQESAELVGKYSNIYHKSDALDILILRSSAVNVNPLLGEEATKRKNEISKAQNNAMIIFLNRLTIGMNNYYDAEKNWIAPLGTMPCDGTEKLAMDILLREDVKASPDSLKNHIDSLRNKANKLRSDIRYLSEALLDTKFLIPQTFRETYWTGIKKWPFSAWNFVIKICLQQIGLTPILPNSTYNDIKNLLIKIQSAKIPLKHGGNTPKFTPEQLSQTKNLAEFEIRDFRIPESDDTIPIMHVNVADVLNHLSTYYQQIKSQVSLLPLQLAEDELIQVETELNKSSKFLSLLTSNNLSVEENAELELLKQEAFSPKIVKPRPSEFTFYSYTPELNKHIGSFVTVQVSVSPHAQTTLQLGQSGHMMDLNLKQHPNAGVYKYTTKDVYGRNVTLTSERRNFSWWSKTDKSGTKQKNSKMVS